MNGESIITFEEIIPKVAADILDPLTDKRIDFTMIEKFMSTETIDKFKFYVFEKLKIGKKCNICKKEIETQQSQVIKKWLCCSSCLHKYHRECEGVQRMARSGCIYCKKCKK